MVDLLSKLKKEPKNEREKHGFIDSADVLSKPIRNIIPLPPAPVVRLLERHVPDLPHMRLNEAKVFPLIIDREDRGRVIECAAVINHPLQGGQVIQLFNAFGPFKRTLVSKDQISAWSAAVSDDWCELATEAIVPRDLGTPEEVQHLKELHEKIKGFIPFRPHLINYINALGDKGTMLDYSIPFQKKNRLLPVLYFNLRGGRILWHDEVLLPAYNEIMLDFLYQNPDAIEKGIDRQSLVLDTFAGMSTLFHLYPELANSWNPTHDNQELSLAQRPVDVWRHIQSTDKTPFMNNLVRHIARNSRI